ncbi:MAG: GDP-L-fucose synthase [Bacteroidales bacterium]|nr:GDP-L-fucose synthase [Bacteroidales bacterium]
MEINAKIYVAGHRGLVGSAIVRKLREKGYTHIVGRTHDELDLTDARATLDFFETEKPDYVFLAAAKVGGILANNTYRAQFIYENLQIQNNVIHAAYLTGVKKLLFLGSSCIYPKNAPQPLREDYLLTSELEYTNEPYAIAKIAGIKMIESYNLQYGTNFLAVMPTNLYGPNDNYDLEKSHVLPALIRKMHLAKALQEDNWELICSDLNKRPVRGINGNSSRSDIELLLKKYGIIKNGHEVSVTLWGSGKPRREFLHSDDMADACVFIMQRINFSDLVAQLPSAEIRNTHINIGTGSDLTISELAHMVGKIIGFSGNILWDTTKPDGTYQKLLDVSKLEKLGWSFAINLRDGINRVYNDYLKAVVS